MSTGRSLFDFPTDPFPVEQPAEPARRKPAAGASDRVLRLVLDTISDGVLVVDRDGRVVLSNPALERIVGPVPAGSGPGDWAGQLEVFRPGAAGPCPADDLALTRALRGEHVEDVEQLVRRAGREDRWVSASAA